MNKIIRFFLLVVLVGSSAVLRAQTTAPATSKSDIEYETVYDDPYDLNKMWLHFYPLYADAFATNFNVGYGGQINYFLKNKFDFRLHARMAYGRGTDFSRKSGEQSTTVDNILTPYKNLEFGVTYHLVDKADAGNSKIIVYTKRYSENKWASTVPEHIVVPSKVRKIIGIRAGGYYWASATNLGDVLRQQKVNLMAADSSELDLYETTEVTVNQQPRQIEVDRKIYGNVSSVGVYLGGSIGRIRNLVVKPKKYDAGVHDVILNMYADVIYAPSVNVEDVRQDSLVFSAAPVKMRNLGFRLGMDGMYNREFSWSWGAELGYRPSVEKRGFYAMVKIGFALASRLQQQRQSYQRELN